jgi:hypothetical protein
VPLPPITHEYNDYRSRDYGEIGEIGGGIMVNLTQQISAQLSASSTFGGNDGSRYQIGTALNSRFQSRTYQREKPADAGFSLPFKLCLRNRRGPRRETNSHFTSKAPNDLSLLIC